MQQYHLKTARFNQNIYQQDTDKLIIFDAISSDDELLVLRQNKQTPSKKLTYLQQLVIKSHTEPNSRQPSQQLKTTNTAPIQSFKPPPEQSPYFNITYKNLGKTRQLAQLYVTKIVRQQDKKLRSPSKQ
ncbi:hypothetical protein SS50377_25767 [Spironucleus salmonicida]|uniref:Uncharacterized protein n=1 Tax=Spironucleus salmonicida TaxID=348837 RepID=A0A9P8LNV5_9EUKA|nr:hypothetical protein SS50377_25767 [Spironucleus salmonicida]